MAGKGETNVAEIAPDSERSYLGKSVPCSFRTVAADAWRSKTGAGDDEEWYVGVQIRPCNRREKARDRTALCFSPEVHLATLRLPGIKKSQLVLEPTD